jgi:hypothetical protein
MIKVKPGNWYWAVLCSKCGLPIIFLEDKGEGQSNIKFAGPGLLKMKCPGPDCGNEDTYGVDKIINYQAPKVH